MEVPDEEIPFSADLPRPSLDGDLLGRSAVVNAMADLIRSTTTQTPLCLGLYGDWGSGKTTTLRMVDRVIRSSSSILPVWLDAWVYDHSEDTLWRSLIAKLVDDLEKAIRQDGANTNLLTKLDRLKVSLFASKAYVADAGIQLKISNLLAAGESAVAALAKAAATVVTGTPPDPIDIAGDAAKSFAKVASAVERVKVEEYRARLLSPDQFREAFIDLTNDYLVRGQRRLVILVDDLDRCMPERALAVLEAFKIFLNVPECICVFAFDRRIIELGIRMKYHSALSARIVELDELLPFIDKLIQIPFSLPTPSSALMSNYALSLIAKNVGNRDLLATIAASGGGGNPRTVMRIVNMFTMLVSLVRRGGFKKVQAAEYAAMMKLGLLSVCLPELFRQCSSETGYALHLERAAFEESNDVALVETLRKYPLARAVLRTTSDSERMSKITTHRFAAIISATALSVFEAADEGVA